MERWSTEMLWDEGLGMEQEKRTGRGSWSIVQIMQDTSHMIGRRGTIMLMINTNLTLGKVYQSIKSGPIRIKYLNILYLFQCYVYISG